MGVSLFLQLFFYENMPKKAFLSVFSQTPHRHEHFKDTEKHEKKRKKRFFSKKNITKMILHE